MSHVCCVPIPARDEMAAADDSCAQARANAEKHEISQILAGAKIILTERAEIGILLDPDRQGFMDAAGKLFDEVHLRPTQIHGVVYLAPIRIYFAW